MMPASLRPIGDVAAEVGLYANELRLHGPYQAKVDLRALIRRPEVPNGRVVLVTAITPTPAGEGKTVTAIGLAQALRLLDHRAVVCLREPSMGPVFGLKGGATGGGRCTVEPADEINLHFTGDMHAVTSANNLLGALLDDHLYRGREPDVDVRRIMFHRAVDVNDRALRRMVVGLGNLPREERFDITAASEVMAVLGLARDHNDLRQRLGRIIVGARRTGEPVTANALRAGGAMAALLRDALLPNLVQTQEGGPAFVHTGPFANIAHGTSSLLSALLARRLADYVVIEAGFGADLGAEKFVHLVGAHGGPQASVGVIVATIRALRYHGGSDQWQQPDSAAVLRGVEQLRHHADIVRRLGMRPVICINQFDSDTPGELSRVLDAAAGLGVPAGVSTAFSEGGEGAVRLAELVRQEAVLPIPAGGPLYHSDTPLLEKIHLVAREIYGAGEVALSEGAYRHLDEAASWGMGGLPMCIAKTQYSLSDDRRLRGTPRGFTLHVRDVELRAGAGFIVVFAGDIMTMPALPPQPNAWRIDLDAAGHITGMH